MRNNPLKVTYGGHPALIRLVDFLSLSLILILTGWLLALKPFNEVLIVSLQFSILFLLCGEYTGLYRYTLKNMKLRGQGRLWGTALLSLFLVEIIRSATGGLDNMGYLEYFENGVFSVTLYWYILPFCTLYLTRYLTFKRFIKKKIRVAVIGLTPAGMAVERALIKEYSNMQLDLAFYDDRDSSRLSHLVKSPFKGKVNELVEQARAGSIDEIYIALPMVARDRIRYFLSMMSDTTVDTYIIPDLFSYSSHVSQLRSISNMQTISVFSSPFEGSGAFIKRAEDLVLGGLILIVISSLMVFIALGIKLTSRGPVFFKQDRYGLSGHKIKVWKFRTMHVMENSEVVIQATKNDPRVTRFGAFLRRTSLDELPQFLNVMQGTMSIVGPRPHAVTHNEQYRKLVKNYMIRHKVKPGITGLAQVNGYRGEIDTLNKMEKRVYYDNEYIKSWSLGLDMKIIGKTLLKGFVGENAY